MELEGEYDFGNGFYVQAAATWLDAEVRRDSNAALIGTTPTLIPETELSLLGTYAFSGSLQGLELGAGVRHRGESFADAANTLTVPDSTIYDLYASYAFKNGLEANLSVTNVADERYVTGCQTAYVCSYGSGREFNFSVTSRF